MRRTIFLVFCVLGLLYPQFSAAAILLPFKGEIEFPQKEFLFTLNPGDENPISIKITQKGENLYQLLANIDHLKTSFFDDVSTVIEGTIEVIRGEDNTVRALNGKVWSQYTLINYKPVVEASGQFEIKGDTLYLNSLAMGDVICKGTAKIAAPYSLDLSVELASVDMKDFLTFFMGKHEIAADGKVQGEVHIGGELDQMQLKGKLASYYGLVDKLKYDIIELNAQGVYPVIQISDSNITQEDGVTFNIAGNLDLSDKGNFKKQIKLLSKQPLVNTGGGDLEWTLKRFESEERSGTTELKYLRRKEEDVTSHFEGESGMLGVQRKLEF